MEGIKLEKTTTNAIDKEGRNEVWKSVKDFEGLYEEKSLISIEYGKLYRINLLTEREAALIAILEP